MLLDCADCCEDWTDRQIITDLTLRTRSSFTISRNTDVLSNTFLWCDTQSSLSEVVGHSRRTQPKTANIHVCNVACNLFANTCSMRVRHRPVCPSAVLPTCCLIHFPHFKSSRRSVISFKDIVLVLVCFKGWWPSQESRTFSIKNNVLQVCHRPGPPPVPSGAPQQVNQ